MLRQSPQAAKVVCDAFGLGSLSPELFPQEIERPTYGVYAEHGDRFDEYNRHVPTRDRWAFGDAVAIYLINGLAQRVVNVVAPGAGPTHPLLAELAEIDNIEPSYLIPAYLLDVIERRLSPAEMKAAKRAVFDSLEALLADPKFSEPAYSAFVRHREIFKAMLGWKRLKVAKEIASLMDGSDNLRAKAHTVHNKQGQPLVVFGHTHRTELTPLTVYGDGAVAHYVNTGTWRRVVMQVERRGFVSRRVSSWLEVHPKTNTSVCFRHVHETDVG